MGQTQAFDRSTSGRACARVRRRVRRSLGDGVALLEVVVALSILLVAMAVVGATFRNGAQNVMLAERMNQAQLLTDRLLTELDVGLIPLDIPEQGMPNQDLSGYFEEDAPPGMSWKLEVTTDENLPDLLKVGVSIFLGDPEAADDQHQRLLTTHVVRVVPRAINLETDFGFSQEQLDQLTEAIPGGAAIFDPTAFDPRAIASLDIETLRELLPALIQALGGGMLGGQLDSILQAAQRGDLSGLQDLGKQLGGLQQPGGASPFAPGGIPGAQGAPPGGRGGQQRGGQQGGGQQRGGQGSNRRAGGSK